MENSYANVEPSDNHLTETSKTKAGLTPRELINYHMNNPDVPISDEDIENLVLDTNIVYDNEDASVDTVAGITDNRMLNNKEIAQIKDHSILTSYDIIDE